MITTDTTYRGIEVAHYNYENETEFYYISGGWWANDEESTNDACSAICKAVKEKHPNSSIVDDSETSCMFFNFDNPNDAIQAIDVLIALGRHTEPDEGRAHPENDEPVVVSISHIMTTRDIIEADGGEGWEDRTWVSEDDAIWYRDRCAQLDAQIERMEKEIQRLNQARMLGI